MGQALVSEWLGQRAAGSSKGLLEEADFLFTWKPELGLIFRRHRGANDTRLIGDTQNALSQAGKDPLDGGAAASFRIRRTAPSTMPFSLLAPGCFMSVVRMSFAWSASARTREASR